MVMEKEVLRGLMSSKESLGDGGGGGGGNEDGEGEGDEAALLPNP